MNDIFSRKYCARVRIRIIRFLEGFARFSKTSTDIEELFVQNPLKCSSPVSLFLVEGRHGGGSAVKTRGKTLVSCTHARESTRATTDRRHPLCFSNPPGLTRALIRPPYTILLPPLVRARRRFRMQNPRESKQSAGADVCAVRFDNNPRALCRGVFLPAVFSPLSRSRVYRSYQKLHDSFGLSKSSLASIIDSHYKCYVN